MAAITKTQPKKPVSLEDINDKLDVILESIASMQRLTNTFPRMIDFMDRLSDQIILAIEAIKDTNRDVKGLNERLLKLEASYSVFNLRVFYLRLKRFLITG